MYYLIMKLKYELVYKNLPEEYKKQIFKLWNSVLNKEEQLKRIEQVIIVFKNEDDKIVGVCTVYTDILRSNNKLYYFFRSYTPKPQNPMLSLIILKICHIIMDKYS